MEIRKSSGLLACAGLLALALLSGCGSSTSTTIPSIATIFYGHTLLFGNHSTALTTGYNGFGQLGIGNLTNIAAAAVVPGTGPVSGGATGAEHTIVFGNTSTVSTWGYNLYGQLGNAAVSTVSTAAYSASPVKVHGFGGATVTNVAAGGYHSLAVANGTVYAWGYNGYGQLGNNSLVNAVTPIRTSLDNDGNAPLGSSLEPVVQVAAGGNHSLALTALNPSAPGSGNTGGAIPGGGGRVYAWGNNALGQIGANPANLLGGLYSALPVLVNIPAKAVPATQPEDLTALTTPLSNVKQITAGGSTSYALSNDGVTVWAWGYNGMGQLGLDPTVATNVFRTLPVKVDFGTLLGTGVTITKISAGNDHVLALLSNNNVVGWGFNGLGQVGNNDISAPPNAVIDHTRIFQPVLVLTGGTAVLGSGVPLANVTDIIAFGNQSLAKIGNSWFGWGDNGFGQLGNPVSTTSIGYLLIPALVQGF
jgi:alpha-tubulin suppressor-like RCC1 family protein